MIAELSALAREAGKLLMSYYRVGVHPSYKPDGSPFSKADIEAQDVIVKGLQPFGYPIISEELPNDALRMNSAYVWIVDPLDGTQEFLQGMDEFCVMIGLAHRGVASLGVIYLPVFDTLYYAEAGQGAYVVHAENKPVRLGVSSVSEPAQLRMLTSRFHPHDAEKKIAEALQCQTLTCGSAGLKAMKIAEGNAELMLSPSFRTGEWDSCALDAIVHEARGSVTDFDGKRLQYNKVNPNNPRGFIVSNGKVHKAVLDVLQ